MKEGENQHGRMSNKERETKLGDRFSEGEKWEMGGKRMSREEQENEKREREKQRE